MTTKATIETAEKLIADIEEDRAGPVDLKAKAIGPVLIGLALMRLALAAENLIAQAQAEKGGRR